MNLWAKQPDTALEYDKRLTDQGHGSNFGGKAGIKQMFRGQHLNFYSVLQSCVIFVVHLCLQSSSWCPLSCETLVYSCSRACKERSLFPSTCRMRRHDLCIPLVVKRQYDLLKKSWLTTPWPSGMNTSNSSGSSQITVRLCGMPCKVWDEKPTAAAFSVSKRLAMYMWKSRWSQIMSFSPPWTTYRHHFVKAHLKQDKGGAWTRQGRSQKDLLSFGNTSQRVQDEATYTEKLAPSRCNESQICEGILHKQPSEPQDPQKWAATCSKGCHGAAGHLWCNLHHLQQMWHKCPALAMPEWATVGHYKSTIERSAKDDILWDWQGSLCGSWSSFHETSNMHQMEGECLFLHMQNDIGCELLIAQTCIWPAWSCNKQTIPL